MNLLPILAPIAVLTLLATPWIVRRPLRSIVVVYAATLPIASVVTLRIPLPQPFNSLSSLLGAAAVLACVAHVALYRRGRVPGVPVGIWASFLAWGILTSFWALDAGRATDTVLVAVPLIVLVVVVSLIPAEAADLDALRVGVIASGIVVGSYAFFLLVTGAGLPSHGVDPRFSLATGAGETNPNILAASLLLPLALSVERILLGGSRWWTPATWRLIGIVGTFFTVVALLLTGSRGGLLAALVTLVTALLFGRRLPETRPWIRRTVLALLAIALAVPAGAFITQTLGTRQPARGALESTVDRILDIPPLQRLLRGEADTSGRAEIWTAGVEACRTRCAAGAGLGNFPEAFNQAYPFSAASKNIGLNQAAHNVYLGIAVEMGLGGLTLFLLAILAEWRALTRTPLRERAPGLRAALLGLLTVNVFLSAIWFKYFWLPFLLIRVAESALAPRKAELPASVPGLTPAPTAL